MKVKYWVAILLVFYFLLVAPTAQAAQLIMDGITPQASTGNCYALSTQYGFGFIPGESKMITKVDLYVTAALGAGSVQAFIYQNDSNGWAGATRLTTFNQASAASSYSNGSISGYVATLTGKVNVVSGKRYWIYFTDPNLSTDGNTEMDCLAPNDPTLSNGWTMVTSSGSYILTNATGAPFTFGAYPAYRIYVPVPATISVSLNAGGTTATYRSTSTIKASVNSDGPVTFFNYGKAIPGCKKVSSVSGVALCTWKPAVMGPNLLTASVTPTDYVNYSANTSSIVAVGATPRSTKR
jgi:hypothetical protein